jgi:hypothetical protein
VTADQLRDRIAAALSTAGAFCGECGFEPGETGCPDCVRVREVYTDAVLAMMQPELTAHNDLARARTTGRRLNYRAQQAESQVATVARAVAEWQFTERGTYMPLRSLSAIAKAIGQPIPDGRFELHYERVERLERELAEALARPAEVVLGGRRLRPRRPGCPDPIECDHEAAQGQAEARLAAVLALLPTDPAEDINAPWIPLRFIRAAATGTTRTTQES